MTGVLVATYSLRNSSAEMGRSTRGTWGVGGECRDWGGRKGGWVDPLKLTNEER